MKKFRNFLLFNITFFALATLFTQAYALPITPGMELMSGSENSQSAIDAVLTASGYDVGPAFELYKNEVGVGEFGAFAGSYQTVFSNTPDDPSEATISWTGGAIIDNPFLLVKDGRNDISWYLFDLRPYDSILRPFGLGWDGMDDLVLSNFWPDQGGISHVTLYGRNPVPEPATMMLLGLGLIGLAGIGRKTRKN